MRACKHKRTEAVRCDANASLTDCVPLGQPACGLGRREYPTCQYLRQWLSATNRSRSLGVGASHVARNVRTQRSNRAASFWERLSLRDDCNSSESGNDSTARACFGLSLRRHRPSCALAPPGIGDTFRPVCFCLTVASDWDKQTRVNVGVLSLGADPSTLLTSRVPKASLK